MLLLLILLLLFILLLLLLLLLLFCSMEAKSTSHSFLRCHFVDALWNTLMNNLRNIDSDFLTLTDEIITSILIHGDQMYEDKANNILIHAIQ